MVDIQERIELSKKIEELEVEVRDLAATYSRTNELEDEKKYLAKKIEVLDLKTNKAIKTKALTASELIAKVESMPSVPRFETGVAPLDQALKGGIEVGSFVQLAGSSFAGKTHLAIEILSQVATYEKVMFFNFEMGDRRIADRLSKSLSTKESFNNMMVHNSNRELSHIVSEIKTATSKGIKFFAIDSKMKIEVSEEKDDYKKFSLISATLSKLTQELDIIIFLINQISEEDDKTGRMAFKGSGDQLYDTDLALFYLVEKDDLTHRILKCRKNRQDENNFTLDLELDSRGKTVARGGGQYYKSANNAPVVEIEYKMESVL